MSEYSLEVRLKTQQQLLLAQQTIIAYVFGELAKLDPKFATAIRMGFDNAALSAEVLSMREGGTARGEHASDALQLIEELRQITFPDG